ncbi:hypothetical protein EB796_016840 [Bugula neritina]|uniref:Uncharacterized protein n=1 Tax=Bugula neritina TaxID=10212 RepID=A0A7J7JGA6_BUGNE|nr:hypothetical protein EB796_016840 [Bugula neritina]
MKVAVVILAVAIVGAFAQEAADSGKSEFKCTSTNSFVCTFQKLGHTICYHAKKLGTKLADVGSSILSTTLDQGKDLLANGAQGNCISLTLIVKLITSFLLAVLSINNYFILLAVLGTVLEHPNKEGLVGKREQSSFLSKVRDHVKNGFDKLKQIKEGLHTAFKNAVDKLHSKLVDVAALKNIDDDADKAVDDAVDEFNKEGNKGRFAMAKAIAGKIRDIFKAGMDKLRERFGKKVEERALFGFDSISDAWEKAKGHLTNLGGSIADTFRPHIDALKEGVGKLGDQVKAHAGNIAGKLKESFDGLKGKLSGHIDTLKGHAATLGSHATNALKALGEAVAGITQQVASNISGTASDAVKTVVDAAGVVSNHVGDAVAN